MNLTYDELTPIQKVAIILAQYPSIASNVLKNYSEEDIQEISLEIINMKEISSKLADKVLEEFNQYYEDNSLVLQGGVDTVKKILETLYTPAQAEEFLANMTATLKVAPLDIIKRVNDPLFLSNFLLDAHPQIIATLLCHLNDTKKAAIILSGMKKEKLSLIVEGMESIEKNGTSEEMLRALEFFLEKEMGSNIVTRNKSSKIGGIDVIAQMVNALDRGTETTLMEELSKKSPELQAEIKKKMFVFEDLLKLTSKDVQRLLLEPEINDKELAICLKYCDKKIQEQVQDLFFSSMAKRKADLIREEMDIIDGIRKTDLEDAETHILVVAKNLADKGDIILGGSSDDFIR